MAAAKKKAKRSKVESNQQRAYPRVCLPGRVYIHDENRLFIAPLNNLSAGGIFIDGLTSIPEGVGVKIVVKSPTLKHAVQAGGSVVRIETKSRKGLAVQFQDISSDNQHLIQRCVEKAQSQTELKIAA